MYCDSGHLNFFFSTDKQTESTVAFRTGNCPTTATGADSQRPTQGAWSTRTSLPRVLARSLIRISEPKSAHESESQTRTVSAGGGGSPSFTTSKWGWDVAGS